MADLSGKSNSQVDCHIDITEDDGLIIIPYKGIPDDWEGAPDICSYRPLDRNFVFAGEQIQLFVCLSANKHNTGSITPSNNGIEQRSPRQNEKVVGGTNPDLQEQDANTGEQNNQNGEAKGKIDSQNGVSTDELFRKMEYHRRKTDQLLQRFKNSHFFARIVESNEPLWSERSAQEVCLRLSEMSEEKLMGVSSKTTAPLMKKNPTSVMIDSGEFDSPTSGGVARGAAKCCSLSNGDIVVILQVKVGVELMKEPILEILQFEKYHERNSTLENQHILTSFRHDPCGELLNWLLPVNNARRSSSRPSSPVLNYSSSTQSLSTKALVSSGSELVSFGHVRSYSMSSLQPARPIQAITAPNAKPSSGAEDLHQFSFKNFMEIGKSNDERLLSFRGVSLVPERFSVQCGLEGVFTPGRRWRRRLKLIQPLEIHTFSVDCNTDDLLCVHVKNVSPENSPEVVVFIDSVTIVFEEESKGGPPLSIPIACTEAGNNYSLPNLSLRSGEEHSFILKPAITLWKHSKGQTRNLPPQYRTASSSCNPSHVQYAILVSCRCNYTESKLFFKHQTSWQPRIARDLMISVASEISRQTLASDGTPLPVQVLSLQASNMTSDDLTLTVFAINDDRSVQLSDVAPKRSDRSSTHLWLQSRVPIGCVRSQSTANIKFELLPLKDGIITLDSLQIDVKEKGLTYMPKHPLKINASQAPQLL